MIETEQVNREQGVWQRWLVLWHGTFYTSVAISTLLYLYQARPPDNMAAPKIAVLCVVGLCMVWYLPSVVWMQRGGQVKPPFILLYLLLGWGIWFALVVVDPVFMLMLFALFPHMFQILPLPWASIGAIILGSLVSLRQMTLWNFDLNAALLFVGLSTILGISLAYYIQSIIRESTERRELIHKLESTRRELAAAERHAGILQERQRLAAEIHDTLAQGLISIVMHLEAAEGGLNNVVPNDDVARAHQHLDAARSAARGSLNEARRVVWGLLPEALEKQPFEVAIRQILDDWSAANRVPAQFRIEGERQPLETDQEFALLRIIQEALTNITKHAGAQTVTVTLSYMPDRAIIDVQDDGQGFVPEQSTATQVSWSADPRTSGFGLIGIRERLTGFGGLLTLESAPGEGTTLAVEMPYDTRMPHDPGR